MKTFIRSLAFILSLILVFSTIGVFAADSGRDDLRFNSDGEFRILLLADPQDDEDLEQTTTAIISEALDKCKPDLVVYLGDNTVADGYDNQIAAIKAVTAPVIERGVPFAIVFGNHDEEHGVSKETLLEVYRSLGCLTYDASPELHGCGTCNLPILSSDGSSIAFNLWLIDSGMYNTDEGASGYDYVHPDQLDWYKRTAASLAAQNGGKVVPAINFQHIVIPEIYDKLNVKLPFSLGELTKDTLGNHYSILPVFSRLNGYWLEFPCPPDVYDGQLDAWVETGDVIAAFHGHDHNNSYNVNIDGVDIVNVPSCGCNSYSVDITRGVGLVTLYEDDPTAYDYDLVNMYDLALEDGSVISSVEGGKSKAYYGFIKVLDKLVSVFFAVSRLYYKIFPEIL